MFVIQVKKGVYFRGDFEDDMTTDDLQRAMIFEDQEDTKTGIEYCQEWYKEVKVVEVEIKIKE